MLCRDATGVYLLNIAVADNMVNNNYCYSTTIINELENSISSDRLSTYMMETLGDKIKAFQLYVWNTDISAAMYGPLQALEITLRNSINTKLSNTYGNNWFNNSSIGFGPDALKKIRETKNRVSQRKSNYSPSDIVADLSMGFWVSLISGKHNYHNTLWIPLLHKAFPNANTTRRPIHFKINQLLLLRNRIAHHENIFKRHLQADYDSILEAIGWMCPDKAHWVDAHYNFSTVLSQRP